MKSEVKIKTGIDYLEPVYELVRETFKRSGLSFMKYGLFERQMLGLGEGVKVFMAEHRWAIQGGMVTPFSQRSAYYVYGGSVENPTSGAMNLLHWNAIGLFRSLSVKQYDFVGARINPAQGSKQEGLAFKERSRSTTSAGLCGAYLHPLKYRLYNLAARLRRGGDIVDEEKHKLEHFGRINPSQAINSPCEVSRQRLDHSKSMPRQLAQLTCIAFVFYLLRCDRKQNKNVSWTLWLPTLWIFSISTKSIDFWLGVGGGAVIWRRHKIQFFSACTALPRGNYNNTKKSQYIGIHKRQLVVDPFAGLHVGQRGMVGYYIHFFSAVG